MGEVEVARELLPGFIGYFGYRTAVPTGGAVGGGVTEDPVRDVVDVGAVFAHGERGAEHIGLLLADRGRQIRRLSRERLARAAGHFKDRQIAAFPAEKD